MFRDIEWFFFPFALFSHARYQKVHQRSFALRPQDSSARRPQDLPVRNKEKEGKKNDPATKPFTSI